MSRLIGFGIPSQELADYLIEKYGFPDNILISRFERPVNQDGWIVNIYSPDFPEHGDLDMLSTARLAPGYKYIKKEN